MMELLVKKFKEYSSLSATGKTSSRVSSLPYILELIAVMERVLAFCYTGSARVLVKDLMQPLWTTLSLKAYTTPILNPNIIHTSFGNTFTLNKAEWPVTAAHTAAMASQKALSLTYSEYLAEVSSAAFFISCSISLASVHGMMVKPSDAMELWRYNDCVL
jgi:hypothetical protein